MAVTDKIGSVVLNIARHAEVPGDKKGTMRGLLNEKLDEAGQKQADELADLFRDIPLAAAFTDDLTRTQQTLEPILAGKGIKGQVDVELRSWDVGPELEGKSIEANKAKIKQFKSQPHLIPLGGKSWGDYIQQVRNFFSRYWAMGLESGPILLILHGSGVQIVWDIVGAMELGTEYDQTPLEPSGVAALYLSRSGPKVKILRGGKANLDE